MLRRGNTGVGGGENSEKGQKFPFHLFPLYVHVINAIIYSLVIHFLYFLGCLSLRYFPFPALSAARIGNSYIHVDHLLNS